MKARACAWAGYSPAPGARAVWARGQVSAVQCPKSVITAESLGFLEEFRLWKEAGGGFVQSMNAKSADAILLLEREWQKEGERGE